MNWDRKRHSSCSRLSLLRSRAQRKFTLPSLSVSASPWRQRGHCKWRCAPVAVEASLKVTITAAVPAWRQTGTGPWRLFGDAQRCESKEREALWLAALSLKASVQASHVCSSQSIDEVASKLKEAFSFCTVDAFTASTINLHNFPKEADALSAVLKQRDLADQLVKKGKILSLRRLLLSFMVFRSLYEVSPVLVVVYSKMGDKLFSVMSLQILCFSL